MDLTDAMNVLLSAIKSDAGYRESWKANIAMAFKDEFANQTLPSQHVDEIDVHEIANNAADNFLNLLVDNEYKYLQRLPDGSGFFNATI